jgi:uncharacterized protein (TIGR03790 family)
VDRKLSSIFFALLVVLSGASSFFTYEGETLPLTSTFIYSEHTDIWNETPFRTVAVSGGFTLESLQDYSDVGVLINNQSEASRTIGWAFVSARNISTDRVFIFTNDSTPSSETINRDQFNTYFAEPLSLMLANRNLTEELNYLVTTKGIPLRINGGLDKASFDQEISLLEGWYHSDIGTDYWIQHTYGPLAGKDIEAFSREDYGFYLVTRLTGYNIQTALDLIEKANNSLGTRGNFVLDLATNRNNSGYKYWNDDLYVANTTLNQTLGLPTIFDETSLFLTNISNVMAYASWGSNDGSWAQNILTNGGLDVNDTTWSSGSQYWNATSPSLSSGDEFDWSYQTQTKHAGSGALEASLSTACTQESGKNTPGIYAEYFDNNGVSFSTASMPDLMVRTPDHVRLENNLAYSSSSQAYQGLDNRFKNDWGARFSGLIDIPETGNWTFYLTTDDGSELWLDDSSIVQNHGSHGMTEISHTLMVTKGFHDFRIEFFQGGGPHGLQFSWEGPNTSKNIIPTSAFFVSGNITPSQNSLIHKWDFEEGSGNFANDSVGNDSDFTLNGMASTNWRTCVDGGCLWYDGVDDYLQVDVDDWVGNFTVSQWVWANTSAQSTYASTFAIDNDAGSNYSFQHAIINGEWKLHNNQSHTFGVVEQQKWAHLVTVFDNGQTRQYLDGVLVGTNSFPNGSFNNIDLYKLGVNRAGSSYYEGMIDNLRIWDTALSNGSITSLHREIYKDCSAYSGHGQTVASIEQTFTLPSHFENHAWILSVQGIRTGDVYGEFEIEVESLDVNGTIIATNKSSSKAFTTSWQAATLRYRPPSNTHAYKITIPLDIVSTSTDGSLFLDTVNLKPIRPHNQWANGSIAETAVSTGGRSFNWDTSYGQSLVADLLEDGVSGAKGYVYEPYLTAISYPSVLHSTYAQGYTMAESYYAANTLSGWMGVVIGDPKMAAFADGLHDIHIIDARVITNVSQGQNSTLEIALENLSPGQANGSITLRDLFGGLILGEMNISIPGGDQDGSRAIVQLQFNSSRLGWNELVIGYESNDEVMGERVVDNNHHRIRVWVNDQPTIDDIYCDSNVYSRGDTFGCTVIVSDDNAVIAAMIGWSITDIEGDSTSVVWSSAGSSDQLSWWTSFQLGNDVPLGWLTIYALAIDASNQSTTYQLANVSEVVNAQARWYGVHVEGVDSDSWSGATHLLTNPIEGVHRGEIIFLKACVIDPDHDVGTETPTIIASKGVLGEIVHENDSIADQNCYSSTLLIEVMDELEPFLIPFTLTLVTNTGAIISSRVIKIDDYAPSISIDIVDSDGNIKDRLHGSSGEMVRIRIDDFDDPITTASGEMSLVWPGYQAVSSNFYLEANQTEIILPIAAPSFALESGEVIIEVTIQGLHQSENNSIITIPLLLRPPEIISLKICDASGNEINELMLGHSAYAFVWVNSDRDLATISTTLYQDGWAADAPEQHDYENNCAQIHNDTGLHIFNIHPDLAFGEGGGLIKTIIRDLDGLSVSEQVSLQLRYAPPVIETNIPVNTTAGETVNFQVIVTDADGVENTECGITLFQGVEPIWDSSQIVSEINSSGISTWTWLVPKNLEDNLTVSIICTDPTGQSTLVNDTIRIDAPLPCPNCKVENIADGVESGGKISSTAYIGIAVVIILLAITSLTFALRRKEEIPESEWFTQQQDSSQPPVLEDLPGNEVESIDERIPEGWTAQQFIWWLDGPIPEDWSEDDWYNYRLDNEDLREVTSIHEEEVE